MRPSVLIAFAALAFALSPLACASDPAEDNVVTPPEEGNAEDELRAFSLTDADNGKTVTVTEGQNLLVKLQSIPSAGYGWQVASTDRTFGFPSATHFFPNGDAIGAGGIERFTWKTKGALSLVGEHRVTMEYKRPWEKDVAPLKTFGFTVNIVAVQCPELSPPPPDFCAPGEQIRPKHNDQGCLSGFECAPGCGATGCATGSSCVFCWGSMTCIPSGAMC